MPAPANLIHETSTTTGTGNLTVAAVNGKVRFSDSTDGFGTGGSDQFWYFISSQTAAEWEIGTGSMSDANTLVRDTVLSSSNSDALVNFSAGTKDVTNDVPAESQYYTGGTDVAVADGGTGASNATDARTNLGVGIALLTSGTVSAQATLDIVLTSYTAYRGLKFVLDLLPVTDAVDLLCRLSSDGGSSYDAGASNYIYAVNSAFATGVASAGSSGATSINIAGDTGGNGIGNGASEGVHAIVEIFSQTLTAFKPKIFFKSSWHYQNNDHGTYYGSGRRDNAQDTDAIRFLFSSGNIASGSYAVYGYA